MTENIQIRRYQPEDIKLLYDAVMESKAELIPWMPWCHADYSMKDSEEWGNSRDKAWKKNEDWAFIIINSQLQFLGLCSLHRIDIRNNTAELGYWIRTSATNQGVATEATTQLCQWGFREKSLHRIEILAAAKNLASQRVAEKTGAICEGILKERLLLHERRHDCALFALLNNSK